MYSNLSNTLYYRLLLMSMTMEHPSDQHHSMPMLQSTFSVTSTHRFSSMSHTGWIWVVTLAFLPASLMLRQETKIVQ